MDSFGPDAPHTTQGLRATDDIVQNSIPRDSLWYSVLDLKDAFFCILVDQDSQPLFAFEWQDPESRVKTDSVLLDSLTTRAQESPAIFGETLSQDFKKLLKIQGRILLQ